MQYPGPVNQEPLLHPKLVVFFFPKLILSLSISLSLVCACLPCVCVRVCVCGQNVIFSRSQTLCLWERLPVLVEVGWRSHSADWSSQGSLVRWVSPIPAVPPPGAPGNGILNSQPRYNPKLCMPCVCVRACVPWVCVPWVRACNLFKECRQMSMLMGQMSRHRKWQILTIKRFDLGP